MTKVLKLSQILEPKNLRVGDMTIQPMSCTNEGIFLREEKFSKNLSKSLAKNKIAHKGDFIFGMSRKILNFGMMKFSEGSFSSAYKVYKCKFGYEFSVFLDLYIRLNHDYFFQCISGGAREGQSISEDILFNLEVNVPDNNDIENLVRIVDFFNSKIELYQQMNETLEEIAKTLFKSWFIDFDPVRAKTEGRPTGLSKEISDLFPDSFEDSELGEIPKGWKLSNLDSNLEFVLGGDWGKEELKDDFNKEVVCIRGADIPNLQTFVESNPPKRFIKESSFEKRELKEGDLVLEISGGSPTQSTGRVVYITKEFLSTQDCPVVFSNFCRILRSDSTLSKYVYYYLRTLYDSDKLFQYETGTTGIKNFDYKYFSEEVFFALPNIDLLKIFSEIIESFLFKKGKNLREIITLTNLRDILLPKLISGELKIPDAENLIEEAGI